MKNFIASLENKRAAAKDESGFSLIDVVVTVAIIVALSVGGFVAYSGIVTQAKAAGVSSAADQVRTAMVVADNDSDPATTHATVLASYNGSASTGSATVTETGAATAAGTAGAANGTGYVTAISPDYKDAATTPNLVKVIKLG